MQQNMDAAEDAAELKQVEEMDAVNEESKANLANALAGKMAAQKQANMDAAEDAAELKKVEEMDAVNEKSKAALAEGLAGKIAKEKAKEAAFQEQAEEEIQAAIDKDNAEEAEELKQIEKADPVNEESKAALADALAEKMAVQKQVNMDAAEEAEELKKVKEMDSVNEESKAALADALAGKMAAQKQADAEGDILDEFDEPAKAAADSADALASQMEENMDDTYVVYYWSACQQFWGRAIGIILTLDAAGVKYVIKDKEKADFSKGLAVPMITLTTGQTLSQTPAILDILGERLNLMGETEDEILLCKQSIYDMDDIFGESKNFKEKPDRAKRWFSLLETRLAKHQFLVCDSPTVADFHGVFAFEWVHARFGESYGEEFPNLARWWKDVCEVPVVKKMKTSGIVMIPT